MAAGGVGIRTRLLPETLCVETEGSAEAVMAKGRSFVIARARGKKTESYSFTGMKWYSSA